ncbi:G-type lectin S-receptor-like serine/threonine-protein kinase SD2-5 [Camellia lanceoleosa]|uniref:G-type lectin S-receptor-like serine/threonine-protein kinase SD2-5 n=1 Tax=Camellia lanceoleosa TaxID=1840588 RepID=A0ACC0H5H0_9ERIC|nr:G-type lectin S-receptor-like serine/threonine-protein kinase SD2-5 [Camellia lanceoleosa]
MHLLSLFKRKAEEERLIDIVDKGNDEMQLHSTEVVEMMRVAVWCLQSDFSKRPSMSVVVKVLEGSVDVDNNLDYNFMNPVIRRTIADAGQQEDAIGAACTLLSPLALSGPSVRKNLDRSQPEDMHLLSLFKRKAEEERLIDIVDKGNDEIQLHSTEVVEMMRVVVWCLESDFSKRLSMSMVVKVLEGSFDVENNLDDNFINPVIRRTIPDADHQEDAIGASCTLLSPLALSGPR